MKYTEILFVLIFTSICILTIVFFIIPNPYKHIYTIKRREKFSSNNPYYPKMSKQSGEPCEYPTECASLACISNEQMMSNIDFVQRVCL